MIRLDKYLAQMNIGSRSEVKTLIKKGRVRVNDEICKDEGRKIDENKDIICYDGQKITYEKYVYYMLNKPAGVVSATKDNLDKTVLDLMADIDTKDLFPVGRLDKDTEGLLLITNDGELSHNLLSPKKHIPKTYRVLTAESLTKDQLQSLEEGVDIGEEKKTLPAKTEQLDEKELLLTICEGRFHQVKRMLKAVGNEVIYLERKAMGKLVLDENLKRGEFRRLTDLELKLLKGN